MLSARIGMVGGGQMARALARGFVSSNLIDPVQILVHDPVAEAINQFLSDIPGAHSVDNNRLLVQGSDVVVLAIKPQCLQEVTGQLSNFVSNDKLIVSIIAGASIKQLCQGLGSNRVVRVMPNTPCLVGQGASGYCLGPGATPEDGQLMQQLLESVGIAFQLDESHLDAVTGLSGSGPAYVCTIIEALSDGGVRMGLPRDVATALAAQTVLGAAALIRTTGEHPAVLKDRVASPGGTTIAGLQQLEDCGLRAALIAAVEAASLRSAELGRDA